MHPQQLPYHTLEATQLAPKSVWVVLAKVDDQLTPSINVQCYVIRNLSSPRIIMDESLDPRQLVVRLYWRADEI